MDGARGAGLVVVILCLIPFAILPRCDYPRHLHARVFNNNTPYWMDWKIPDKAGEMKTKKDIREPSTSAKEIKVEKNRVRPT